MPIVRGSEKNLREDCAYFLLTHVPLLSSDTAVIGEAFNALINPCAVRVYPEVTNRTASYIFNGSFDT
jgi:hypothetical protein